MSLNSVVNNLVRAASSVPADISDADLDSYVAKLLAEEAKVKEAKWNELGLGSIFGSASGRASPDSNAPKPNKRFLASIIRTVDGHNAATSRDIARAAAEKEEKLGESSRLPRSVKDRERTNRLFGAAMRHVDVERDSSRANGRNGTSDRGGRHVWDAGDSGDDRYSIRGHRRSASPSDRKAGMSERMEGGRRRSRDYQDRRRTMYGFSDEEGETSVGQGVRREELYGAVYVSGAKDREEERRSTRRTRIRSRSSDLTSKDEVRDDSRSGYSASRRRGSRDERKDRRPHDVADEEQRRSSRHSGEKERRSHDRHTRYTPDESGEYEARRADRLDASRRENQRHANRRSDLDLEDEVERSYSSRHHVGRDGGDDRDGPPRSERRRERSSSRDRSDNRNGSRHGRYRERSRSRSRSPRRRDQNRNDYYNNQDRSHPGEEPYHRATSTSHETRQERRRRPREDDEREPEETDWLRERRERKERESREAARAKEREQEARRARLAAREAEFKKKSRLKALEHGSGVEGRDDDRCGRYDSTDNNITKTHDGTKRDESKMEHGICDPDVRDDTQGNSTTPAPPSAIPPPPPSAPPPTDSPPLPPSPPRMASKMDKYFNTSYDPRLDLGEVPAEGLIQAVGWDGMLEVLKERGRKKRAHSPTRLQSPSPGPPAPSSHSRAYSHRRDASPDDRASQRERERERDRKARRAEKADKADKAERKAARAARRALVGEDDSDEERERARRKEKRRREKEELAKLGAAKKLGAGADAEGMVDGEGSLAGYRYVPKGGIREWDLGK